MRIALLHSYMAKIGGAQTFIEEVANRMVKRGHDVAIVAAKIVPEVFNLDSRVKCISISRLHGKSPSFWAYVPIITHKMRRVLQSGFDVAIANHFPSNVALPKSCIPGIWMCQEPFPFFHNRAVLGNDIATRLKARAISLLYSSYDKKAARQIRYIVANSKFTKSEIGRIFGKHADVVYPGFDESLLKMSPLARKDRTILAGSPSTLLKGFEYTLGAFVRLARRGVAHELRVVGEVHPIYLRMIERVKKEDSSLRIVIRGVISRYELLEEYRRASMLSYPSINEPFGIMPIEAAALRTPILYFKSGGLMETMIEGKTGLGAKPADLSDYEEKMVALLENPIKIQPSSSSMSKHLNMFTWKRTTEDLLNICRRSAAG